MGGGRAGRAPPRSANDYIDQSFTNLADTIWKERKIEVL